LLLALADPRGKFYWSIAGKIQQVITLKERPILSMLFSTSVTEFEHLPQKSLVD
jgi:hypothetical protein